MRIRAGLGLMLVALVLTGASRDSEARIWTVEKDGSGDFTVVQHAVDAAVSGDSILVGPGRYETLHVGRLDVDGALVAMVLAVQQKDLSIIGAGRDVTTIGPASRTEWFEGEETASLLVDYGASAHVQGLSFDNTQFEVNLYGRTVFEDCRVERVAAHDSFSLTVAYDSGSVVRRTELLGSGGLRCAFSATGLLVEDCYFDLETEDSMCLVTSSAGTTIRNCTFVSGALGVQFARSGSHVMEDCSITGMRVVGIEDSLGGQAVVRRCHVGVTRMGLKVGWGPIEVYDSVFEGGTQHTILTTGHLVMRGSHILNAGGNTVLGSTSAPGEFVDLRHNWWGTSDRAQIAAWIVDEDGTVFWEPFNDMPIPTESSSMSELKGKFGGRE